jgi:translation initiation factor IF-1
MSSKAVKGINLAVVNPDLTAEWYAEKNHPLAPEQVRPFSGKKVWWHCENGHEWQATIDNRSRGSGCPYCYGRKAANDTNLAVVNPDLAAEWHTDKNLPLTPEQVRPFSGKNVWWHCKKGHEWEATIANRGRGSGCPYCYGKKVGEYNNLAFLHPDLADEWHPEKNNPLTPEQVRPFSNRKVWWQCEIGHEWKANISNRSRGKVCPYCSGRYASKDK